MEETEVSGSSERGRQPHPRLTLTREPLPKGRGECCLAIAGMTVQSA